jgi:hypothetical protein
MKPLLPVLVLICSLALGTSCLAQTATPDSSASPPPVSEDQSSPAMATSTVVLCKDVQERTPVDAGDTFPSDVGTLFCFSNVTGATSPVQIYHRWYVGDRMVMEIPISVKAATWRCWSRKTIVPSWQGPCRVDVATESGDVIGSATFTLAAPGAAPQG